MQMNRKSGSLSGIQRVLGFALLSLDLTGGEPKAASPPSESPVSVLRTSARLGAVTRVTRETRVQILPSGAAVTLDPGTKRIRAAWPGELAALVGAMAGTSSGNDEVTIVHYENGAKSALLPVSYLETATAVRRPDGTIAIECQREQERKSGSRNGPPQVSVGRTPELR